MKVLGVLGDALVEGMKLREKRMEVVAGNIANASTPNFTPFKLSFEKEFQKALGELQEEINLKTTSQKHIKEPPDVEIKDLSKKISPEPKYRAPIGMDKNLVDLEEEYGIMVKDSLLYKTLSQLFAKEVYINKYVLDEAGKV
ncbi:flagellar basal body rod protein FlgB [Desulfurobacterium crinifex]